MRRKFGISADPTVSIKRRMCSSSDLKIEIKKTVDSYPPLENQMEQQMEQHWFVLDSEMPLHVKGWDTF